MKKLRIGIDFDDVLVDCNTALQDFHNTHYGTTHTKDDVTSHNLETLWGCTREEMYARLGHFLDSEHHNEIGPLDGAVEAIQQLSLHHELYIITARRPEAEEVTKKLLQHFQTGTFGSWTEIFSALHFTGTSTGTNLKITKAEVCKSESIDVFIDDHIDNVRNVSSVGIPSLLMNQPWNKNEPLPVGAKRVHSWSDILKEINQIALV